MTADGVPLLLLPVAGHGCPAILDTGFNGELERPDSLRNVRARAAEPALAPPGLLACQNTAQGIPIRPDFSMAGAATDDAGPAGTILLKGPQGDRGR